MQPEDIPQAAPLVIAVYGRESDKNTLARKLAQDGYDVRSLKHAIVLRTPQGSAERGVKRALRVGELAGPRRSHPQPWEAQHRYRRTHRHVRIDADRSPATRI